MNCTEILADLQERIESEKESEKGLWSLRLVQSAERSRLESVLNEQKRFTALRVRHTCVCV